MERIYPHEHSEWFKPYVAAYYAFVYLCAGGLRRDDPNVGHITLPTQGNGELSGERATATSRMCSTSRSN